MTDATFIDFCNYIVSNKDSEGYDPDAVVDFFVHFLEPFATEKGIEIPQDVIDLVEVFYEAGEGEEEAEEDGDEDEEEGDEDEEEGDEDDDEQEEAGGEDA